jgi:hypothetical protein
MAQRSGSAPSYRHRSTIAVIVLSAIARPSPSLSQAAVGPALTEMTQAVAVAVLAGSTTPSHHVRVPVGSNAPRKIAQAIPSLSVDAAAGAGASSRNASTQGARQQIPGPGARWGEGASVSCKIVPRHRIDRRTHSRSELRGEGGRQMVAVTIHEVGPE